MSRNTFLVLGVGLLLGYGLTLSVGAYDTDLDRPGLTLTTLDGPGNVGQYTSVTIGADGLGLISYYDATNGDLKVAHCSNVACTAATLTTLDSAGDVGQYTLRDHRRRRPRPHQLLRRDQRRPQGGPLLQLGLHRRHPHHPGHARRCRPVHAQ